MSWEAALRQRLMDDAGVTAIVGTAVFWKRRDPASGLPAVVLTLVSGARPQTLTAFQTMKFGRVQVDCLADGGNGTAVKSRAQVVALREAVIAALADAGTYHGTRFARGQFEPERDLGEATETGFVHRDSFDFLTLHD